MLFGFRLPELVVSREVNVAEAEYER